MRRPPVGGGRVQVLATGHDTPSYPDLQPRRRPRQRRARETVAALLQAAAELIDERGYAATTTNRIADRAGVSVGSLYQYFPNKAAILACLREQHQAAVKPITAQAMAELRDTHLPVAEVLRGLFVRLVELNRGHPRLQRVLATDLPHPPIEEAPANHGARTLAQELAESFRQRDEIHVKQLDAAAHVLLQATTSLARWLVHRPPDGLDQEELIDHAVQMLTAFLVDKP